MTSIFLKEAGILFRKAEKMFFVIRIMGFCRIGGSLFKAAAAAESRVK